MTTFVNVGDHVTVYQDPFSMKKMEGKGVVTEVKNQSDMESAFVEVMFAPYDKVWRWILPAHVGWK